MDTSLNDAELIALARGMMYDTATMMEDVARRLPIHAFRLYVLAAEMRRSADYLGTVSPRYASTAQPAEPTAGRESLQPDR